MDPTAATNSDVVQVNGHADFVNGNANDADMAPSFLAAPSPSQIRHRSLKRTRDGSDIGSAAAAPRRVESVVFAGYEILPSFPSPYPFDDHGHHGGHHVSATSHARESTNQLVSKRSETKPSLTNVAYAPPSVALASHSRAASTPGESTDLTPVSMTESETEALSSNEIAAKLDDALTRIETNHGSDLAKSRTASPELGVKSPIDSGTNPPAKVPPGDVSHDAIAQAPSSGTAVEGTDRIVATTRTQPRSQAASRKAERGQGGRFVAKTGGPSPRVRKPSAARLPGASGSIGATRKEQRDRGRRDREALNGGPSHTAGQVTIEKSTKRLFVCEGCFKYMLEADCWNEHRNECTFDRPPGRKVYENGSQTIYEIDGADEKLYCQNLCLFGKLFIEHKYIFFDVEGFMFYIVTEKSFTRDSPVAYFSKEKNSYDDYNLACIVTFPPYRQKGWATLLIEFSYEITRRFSETPGTPERPLSELGLKGYLHYWISVLVRYFQQLYDTSNTSNMNQQDVKPADQFLDTAYGESELSELDDRKDNDEYDDEAEQDEERAGNDVRPATRSKTTLTLRRNSAGQPTVSLVHRPQSPSTTTTTSTTTKTRQSSDFALKTPRLGDDRSKTTNAQSQKGESSRDGFSWPTTLERIAYDVNLKPDDVAFALVQSGLASWRRRLRHASFSSRRSRDGTDDEQADEELLEVVVTKDLVDKVAKDKKVKPKAMLDLDKVLL
ncbi:hypothetical protein OIV83_002760 [Microbotryomycetes sp. JL201]|nr:hypothetical protein OIV83_002760 [Microbotryomycetes sp. JL201]